MKKFGLFGLISVLILAFGLAGCGGGGGSHNTDHTGDSSDYFGTEVGYQMNYSYTEYDKGTTTNGVMVMNVISVAQQSDASIYKWAAANDDETLGSDGHGIYVEKKGTNYYYYGDWDGTTDDLENPPTLYVTNPITSSFTSEEWGTNKGQESVTLNAGTFTAWHFKYVDSDSEYTYYSDCWFVPYVGMIKRIDTFVQKSDGKTTYNYILTLNSTAKGVILKNTSKLSKVSPQGGAPSTVEHRGLLSHKRLIK